MRLIDADALELDADYDDGEYWAVSMAQIQNAPTIDPERKKGKWLEMAGDLQCSECGATYHDLYPDYSDTNFCPNCGSYNGGDNDDKSK